MPHLMHSLLCKSARCRSLCHRREWRRSARLPHGIALGSAPFRGEFREALGLPRSLHCQSPEFGSEKPSHTVRSSDRLSRWQRSGVLRPSDSPLSLACRIILHVCCSVAALPLRLPSERWSSAEPPALCRVVTWLILPVVICLPQRLSHACLSISLFYCETAYSSLSQLGCLGGSLFSMGSRSNSRANTCRQFVCGLDPEAARYFI